MSDGMNDMGRIIGLLTTIASNTRPIHPPLPVDYYPRRDPRVIVMELQASLGVDPDGTIGPKTLKAASRAGVSVIRCW